jgi:hypothetical protein
LPLGKEINKHLSKTLDPSCKSHEFHKSGILITNDRFKRDVVIQINPNNSTIINYIFFSFLSVKFPVLVLNFREASSVRLVIQQTSAG